MVFYWIVILLISVVGIIMFDFMDCILVLGYVKGLMILIIILLLIFVYWYFSECLLNINYIRSCKVEVFYWIVIFFLNILGIVLGDFLFDMSGFGYIGGVILIGSLLVFIVICIYYIKIFCVFLFWIVFVLICFFGVIFGDFLIKLYEKGGLDLGMIGFFLVLVFIFIVFMIYMIFK